MPINNEEINDTKKFIKKCGYDPEDFEFSDKDTTDWSIAPETIRRDVTGKLTITRKSTNKQKVYNSSSGNSWFSEFETDLKSGHFD